jgi:hypothetical protein
MLLVTAPAIAQPAGDTLAGQVEIKEFTISRGSGVDPEIMRRAFDDTFHAAVRCYEQANPRLVKVRCDGHLEVPDR